MEEAEASLVSPLDMVGANPGSRNTRGPEAEMGGTHDGNADVGMDITTDLRVGLVPLVNFILFARRLRRAARSSRRRA